MLRDLKSTNQNIFLTVDTTCPLPKSDRPATAPNESAGFAPIPEDHVVIDMHKKPRSRSNKRPSKSKKLDRSEIPPWLKEDLEDGYEGAKSGPRKKAAPSDDRRGGSDQEHIKKMQKEYEQKRKELLLEAENVVRMREEAYNQELMKLQTELEKQKRIQQEHLDKLGEASKTGRKMDAGGCIIQ